MLDLCAGAPPSIARNQHAFSGRRMLCRDGAPVCQDLLHPRRHHGRDIRQRQVARPVSGATAVLPVGVTGKVLLVY
jgi:hypothetical protein